jgi:ActR/RegA family two-component response regulator
MNNFDLPASSVFAGTVLLVSQDAIAIEQLSESMQRFGLSAERCSEVSSALERLERSKFEAVIVDSRLGSQAEMVMEGVRQSPSNKYAVVFAVSDSEGDAIGAFKAGSTFVLRRPLTADSIDLSLKTAYGLILRERRRYFRCPVDFPVAIIRKELQIAHGRTVNASANGMSIATGASLGCGDTVELRFTLPGEESQLALDSTVCWARGQRIGLQFLSSDQTSRLQEWLSHRLEEAIPQSVRDKFANL